MNMTILDKLIPTSPRDFIVIAVVLVGGVILYKLLGGVAISAIGALFFQGSNEEQKKAKTIEQHYKKLAKVHMGKVKDLNQTSVDVEHEILELDKQIFVDSGESNESIVNRIRINGL
jgi:hypothetical protein